jgi:hypothetical protein
LIDGAPQKERTELKREMSSNRKCEMFSLLMNYLNIEHDLRREKKSPRRGLNVDERRSPLTKVSGSSRPGIPAERDR